MHDDSLLGQDFIMTFLVFRATLFNLSRCQQIKYYSLKYRSIESLSYNSFCSVPQENENLKSFPGERICVLYVIGARFLVGDNIKY